MNALLPTAKLNEVAPGLFIGSKPKPGHHPGIDVIVLAAMEYQPPAGMFPDTEVIHAPLDDDPLRSLRLDEISLAVRTASRVARRLRAGRRVLASCLMGLNRSSLVAGLAMHDVFGMQAEEIVARIRHARGSFALSNPHFEGLLRAVIDIRDGKT